jgi:hypothetical protein
MNTLLFLGSTIAKGIYQVIIVVRGCLSSGRYWTIDRAKTFEIVFSVR